MVGWAAARRPRAQWRQVDHQASVMPTGCAAAHVGDRGRGARRRRRRRAARRPGRAGRAAARSCPGARCWPSAAGPRRRPLRRRATTRRSRAARRSRGSGRARPCSARRRGGRRSAAARAAAARARRRRSAHAAMPRLGCSTWSSTGSASVSAKARRNARGRVRQSVPATATEPVQQRLDGTDPGRRVRRGRGHQRGRVDRRAVTGAPNADSDAASIASCCAIASSTPAATCAACRMRS